MSGAKSGAKSGARSGAELSKLKIGSPAWFREASPEDIAAYHKKTIRDGVSFILANLSGLAVGLRIGFDFLGMTKGQASICAAMGLLAGAGGNLPASADTAPGRLSPFLTAIFSASTAYFVFEQDPYLGALLGLASLASTRTILMWEYINRWISYPLTLLGSGLANYMDLSELSSLACGLTLMGGFSLLGGLVTGVYSLLSSVLSTGLAIGVFSSQAVLSVCKAALMGVVGISSKAVGQLAVSRQLGAVKKDRDGLSEELQKARAEIAELKTKQKLKQESVVLKSAVKGPEKLESKVVELNAQIQALNRQLEAAQRAEKSSHQQLQRAQAGAGQKDKELAGKSGVIQALELRISELSGEIKRLKKALEKALEKPLAERVSRPVKLPLENVSGVAVVSIAPGERRAQEGQAGAGSSGDSRESSTITTSRSAGPVVHVPKSTLEAQTIEQLSADRDRLKAELAASRAHGEAWMRECLVLRGRLSAAQAAVFAPLPGGAGVHQSPLSTYSPGPMGYHHQ